MKSMILLLCAGLCWVEDSFSQVYSGFDSDADGWQTTADARRFPNPDYFSTGGNPGGFISATDNSSGVYFYFSAPAKFLGDQSGKIGENLFFDINVSHTGEANTALADVRLQGAGFDLLFDLGFPGVANQWLRYEIPLTFNGGWKKTTLAGSAPTEAEFAQVMADLTLIQIRGEYTTSPDVVGLDNVQFGAGTVPVELVSFSASQSGRTVILKWMTATETNNYGWEVERQKLARRQDQGPGTSTPLSDRDAEWEKVGFLAGNGTTTEAKSYVFELPVTRDMSPVTLRLKQIDLDGMVSFSKILSVTIRPEKVALLQNYPNPFNPETQIRFYLPEAGKVTLSVLDITGKTVAVLVKNSGFQVGEQSVSFSGKELSTGIYFTRLEVGGTVLTSKIMLMK
ncbi:MAG: T9SS type A sorting domain-containing protein [Bacteroidetes bacterium]|nr:T9SS type A sorting domain-containing protein [Bacteroidota bacterium]